MKLFNYIPTLTKKEENYIKNKVFFPFGLFQDLEKIVQKCIDKNNGDGFDSSDLKEYGERDINDEFFGGVVVSDRWSSAHSTILKYAKR